jgi:hypothetical protein
MVAQSKFGINQVVEFKDVIGTTQVGKICSIYYKNERIYYTIDCERTKEKPVRNSFSVLENEIIDELKNNI